jgi:RNA polymerase sigma-70 factor (ECF subfamily)
VSDRPAAAPDALDDVARIFREESGRVVAHLIGRFGDISLAEEAVQDAFVRAAERWPIDGIPPNPGGWITTTARNRALDVVRRESQRSDRYAAATRIEPDPTMSDDPADLATQFADGEIPDDRLQLMFTCCHPALAPEARVALTLRLLGGLTTPEIAKAFLVPEPTMAARITRAKKKIEGARIPYRVPEGGELPDRLDGVLAVLYLVFNEGYFATSGDSLVRTDLAAEAIRLIRVIVGLMPDEPEPLGLLALMLLTEARRPARLDPAGRPVLLADQDRALWDRDLIAEGHDLVRRCLRRNQPGPYQLQAAIAAVHADAATAEATDWGQVVTLYDHLLTLLPTDIVRLNRAIAIAERDGPAAGLALLDELSLEYYGPWHVSRAELLRRVGRHHEAAAAYVKALDLTTNEAERAHLRRRLKRSPGTGSS